MIRVRCFDYNAMQEVEDFINTNNITRDDIISITHSRINTASYDYAYSVMLVYEDGEYECMTN